MSNLQLNLSGTSLNEESTSLEETSSTSSLEINDQAFFGNHTLSSLCVEWFTIRNHITDFGGMNVLIMGSGNGEFCRAAKFMGARLTVGFEINVHKYIQALEFQKREHDLKAYKFYHGDVRNLNSRFEADVIINKFVFNYYYYPRHLYEIAVSMFKNLKKGKRCYIIMRNALSTTFWEDSLSKYGITFENKKEIDNGYSMDVQKVNEDGMKTETHQYCIQYELYEEVLESAGFVNINILPLEANNICSCGPSEFWTDLLKNPHQMVLVAEKPCDE